MDENPYEPPRVVSSFNDRDVRKTLSALRTVVAVLVIALIVQWLCHLMTALAMFGWMNMVKGAPTAKTLDSVFYGFACVGLTAVLALVVGYLGARSLTASREKPSPDEKS